MKSAGSGLQQLQTWPRERLAERVSAASYGTILVLTALAAIDADAVASGLGWELVTGVGVATWLAHLYAELVGDLFRHEEARPRKEIPRAMADGLPILLATVVPAVMLLLGRIEVLDPRPALWSAVAAGVLQLAGVGGYVGLTVSGRKSGAWWYALATAAWGVLVVSLKLLLGH